MVQLNEMKGNQKREHSEVGIGLSQEFYLGDTESEVPVRRVLNSKVRSCSKILLWLSPPASSIFS